MWHGGNGRGVLGGVDAVRAHPGRGLGVRDLRRTEASDWCSPRWADCWPGTWLATVVVAAGVAALVAGSPLVLTVLTAGARLPGVAGDRDARHPRRPQPDIEKRPGSWLRQAAKGAGISGLNPKVFLLFLALLPQFTIPTAAWPIAGADLGAGAGARCQLRRRLHRGRHRRPAGAARPPGGGPVRQPLLRRRHDRDRRVLLIVEQLLSRGDAK